MIELPEILADQMPQHTTRTMPQGRHEVTPPEWTLNQGRYFLTVNPDGTGVLTAQPKPGAISVIAQNRVLTPKPKGTAAILGPGGHDYCPIAGGYRLSKTGMALFRVYWWQDTSDSN